MKSHEVLDGGEGEKIERDVGRRIKVDRDEQKKNDPRLKIYVVACERHEMFS